MAEVSNSELTWFEFLLNRNLLVNHLKKPNPDPPPSALLSQFVLNADKWKDGNETSEGGEEDALKSSRKMKNRFLKLMAMQTAAYLSWDLDIFAKLPIGVQSSLMNHLLAVSEESESEATSPSKFLQSLYHRWVIRTSQINKSSRTNNRIPNPVSLQSEQFVATDTVVAGLKVEESLDYLRNLVSRTNGKNSIGDNDKILIPTQETFLGTEPQWKIGTVISASTLSSMIHLDLGIYLLYEGNKEDAIHHFQAQKIPTENFPFLKITKPKLEGYLRAIGLVASFNQNLEDRKISPSVLNKGRTEEITRMLLEGDYSKVKALSQIGINNGSNKDDDCFDEENCNGVGLGSRIRSSSFGHSTKRLKMKRQEKKKQSLEIDMEEDTMLKSDNYFDSCIYSNFIKEEIKKLDPATKAKYEFVVRSFEIWKKSDPRHREHYDVIFRKLASSVESAVDGSEKMETGSVDFQKLLQEKDEEEDRLILGTDKEIQPINPACVFKEDPYDNDDQLKLMDCEMKLFSANNLDTLQDLVMRYNRLSMGKSIISQNLLVWDLPDPLVHASEKIPIGAFRDYIHMLIVVGWQSFKANNFEVSRSAYQVAINELEVAVRQGASAWGFAQYNIRKLSQMLDWEILLTDIAEMYTNWTPSVNSVKYSRIADRSVACLRCVHQSSDVSPRTDIVDNILLALINLGKYDAVIHFGEQEKRFPFIEFLALLARGCQELADKKDISSAYRDLWNTVLPLCMNSNIVKRHKEGVLANRNGLMWVFDRTCSHTLFTLLVSLFCKLHNNILDDVSLQIHTEYLHIWPNIIDDVTTASSMEIKTRISGSSKFNVTQVRDFILHILERAVIVGGELFWWRCLGDVHLASENPSAALRCYLEHLAVLTDFFEKHNSVYWQDNHLFRRMIKCCEHLQCFIQAVILCQFLTDVDYSVAFGMAQERTTLDASDSLYAFIWDLTILEFLVNLHTKRNEQGKRQIAVKMLGLLELNANNNEEIQREATNLRKSQFMRTLAKRYIVTQN